MKFYVLYDCFNHDQAAVGEHLFSILTFSYAFCSGFNDDCASKQNRTAYQVTETEYSTIRDAIVPDSPLLDNLEREKSRRRIEAEEAATIREVERRMQLSSRNEQLALRRRIGSQ